MFSMESRTSHILEFPKILEALGALCRSDPGRSACLDISPCADIQDVTRRHMLVRQAMALVRETRADCPYFPELSGVWAYVQSPSRVLDLDGVWAVGQFLNVAAQAREALNVGQAPRWLDLQADAQACPWPGQVAAALRRCLGDEGRLKDDSSPELLGLRQDIRQIHQQCSRRVKDFVTEQGIGGYLQDDYMTISSDRYVLPLKSNFKGRVSGIIHDYSQTGETCYVEPMFLVEVNNKLQELRQQERAAEARVLAFLTGLVRQELSALQQLYAWLISLDVLLATVRLSGQMDARPIDVTQQGELRLLQARHPLLVLGGDTVRPVDVMLKADQRVLIVSGGNAGGKTVALKTTGLLALMTISGLPVPVDEGSTLPLWRQVHVFMGDEQSLEGRLSTFSAQIQHLSKVWPEIGPDCLVLLDEFGAGTDPAQGAALAQSVVDGLLEKQAWAAVATHFPALKAYALSMDGVRAASVLFDPQTGKPLYSLAYDQVGASQAMQVAREYGLPDSILARAQQYLLLDGADMSRLIDRLNALAVTREEELAQVREQRLVLAERKRKLRAEFERDKREVLAGIKKQAQDVLAQLRTEKISRRQALRELSALRQTLQAPSEQEEAPAQDWDAFQVGQKVAYPAWNKSGVIQDKDERRKTVKVELGGISLWLPHQDIAPAGGPAGGPPYGPADAAGSTAKKAPSGEALHAAPDAKISLRLDLRGLRADEALSRLGSFLDQALLRGASQVDVIHGRGTGALRREVHQFLKDFPGATAYALANEDQGGDGVTLVTLR